MEFDFAYQRARGGKFHSLSKPWLTRGDKCRTVISW
jgi:hypothetical protein